jgi:hypothetical protein
MTHVYVLQHVHATPSGEEDVKLIGVYVTEAAAQAAVSRLSQQPGLRDHPEGFHLSRYELNKDHWTEGFIGWDEALDES